MEISMLYDLLAARCLVSRTTLKTWLYLICYQYDLDPWIEHIISHEFEELKKEYPLYELIPRI
jgi:hypothetical protein